MKTSWEDRLHAPCGTVHRHCLGGASSCQNNDENDNDDNEEGDDNEEEEDSDYEVSDVMWWGHTTFIYTQRSDMYSWVR